MRLFFELTLMFLIFSFLGWVMEVTLKYIQFHRFINRGFLIGPYCPIYGFGVVFITVVVGGLFGQKGSIIEVFFAGFVICGALEYFTSWYMEKMFHARWWDYSQKPMNLHGRIWIGNLILFGLASVLIVYLLDPYYFKWMTYLSDTLLMVLGIIIIILYLTDTIVSHFLMEIVRKNIDEAKGDNTETIAKEVHLMLKDKSILIQRIEKAYPNFSARPKRIVNEIKMVRRKYHQLLKETTNAKKEFIKTHSDEIKNKISELNTKRKEVYQKLRNLEKSLLKKEKDEDDV